MHRPDRYSQLSSIIWPIWLNGWVFVYELSGCGFESRFCHLNFRYGTCSKQGVLWHSDRLWINSKVRMWHDNNIESNMPYRWALTAQLNHLISLGKRLNVCLRTEWLWVWIPVLSLKLWIWHLLQVRGSLTFRQTLEFRFTLKLVRDMIITYNQNFYISVQEIAILMAIIKTT